MNDVAGVDRASTGGFDLPVLPAFPPLLRCLNSCFNSQSAQADNTLVAIIHSDPAILFKASEFVSLAAERSGGLQERLECLPANVLLPIARWALAWQHANNTPLLNAGGHFLWYRALCQAHVGQALAERAALTAVDEVYMLGMFLDIGRLDFLKETGGSYISDVYALSEQKRLKHEHDVFGSDAAVRGAGLVGRWHQTSFLADAIRYQNAPLDSVGGADPLIRAGVLIPQLAASLYGDSSIPFAEVQQLFGLEKGDVTDLLARAQDSLGARLTLLQEYGLPEEAGDLQAVTERIKHASKDKNASVEADMDDVIATEVGRSLAEEAMRTLFAGVAREQSLQAAVQQGLQLFFGDSPGAVFLRQESGLHAFAVRCASQELLQALTFPMDMDASKIVCAVQQAHRQTLLQQEGLDNDCAIQDQQLLQLLGSRVVHCFPLTVAGHVQGVLVMGGGQLAEGNSWLEELMAAFASTLSHVLQRVQGARDHQTEVQAELNEVFQTRLGVLAHEVKNPLNIISNYLFLLGEKLDEKHPAQKDLEIISSEAERIKKILNQPQSIVLQEDTALFDVNKTVEQQVSLVTSGLLNEKGATSVLNLQESLPKLAIDRDAVKQVLVNLLKNAAESVAEKTGRVEVTTFMTVHDDGMKYIGIEVKDNGPGISAEVYAKLFQRIKSTKGSGHSGVGLSIVKELVNGLNGRVFCKSSGKGAVFTVLFPDRDGESLKHE